MTRLMLTTVLAFSIFAFPRAANADPTTYEYLSAKGEAEFLYGTYLKGAYASLLAVNAHLEVNGKQKLFCAPERMFMQAAQIHSILDRYTNSHPGTGIESTSAITTLLYAMMDTFPCAPKP